MNEVNYCDIYLIRHGETDWNTQGKLQGYTDIPLNEEGKRQALKLKEKLAHITFSAVFSSGLSRANKTATIILDSNELNIIETPALKERYMGPWEGRLTSELKEWLENQKISTDHFSKEVFLKYKWQDEIESYFDVFKRLHDFIKSVINSHIGSTILLSSHGGVLRSVLYYLDFQQGLRWQVPNCAYLKLRVYQSSQVPNLECKIILMEHDGIKLIKKTPIPY